MNPATFAHPDRHSQQASAGGIAIAGEVGAGAQVIGALHQHFGAGPATWHRPRPPMRPAGFVARHDGTGRSHGERLRDLFGSGSRRAALHGGPGLGKSVLARAVAAELDSTYPGGVLYEELTPSLTTETLSHLAVPEHAGCSSGLTR